MNEKIKNKKIIKQINVLILSEEADITTDLVCNWLNYHNCSYLRINREKKELYDVEIRINNDCTSIFLKDKNCFFDISHVSKVWFRRGYLDFSFKQYTLDCPPELQHEIFRHLNNESNTLEQFVYYYLRQRQAINDPSVYNCNKLIALHEAKKINFKIPNTIISKYTNNIRHFVSQNSPCITKDIQDVILLKYEDSICTSSTQKVDIEELTLSQYGYSLFQKEIKKRYELRIFYFLEDIYAMAIFSQMDANSQTDFRLANINSRKPIRQVPFCLPKMIEKQLKKLMKSLNLESGSIDMIVDNDNNYWFLEVNPVGQFHFLSQVCNYNIEQKIAKYLAL